MKKRKILALCCSAVLGLTLAAGLGALTVSAEEQACFTTSQSGVTVNTTSKGITTATGTAGETMVLDYTAAVDFDGGASFRYVIPKASDIDIKETARKGDNYIRATVKDGAGYGVEFKIYALYSKTAASKLNKMQVDVTYLDPTIEQTKGDYTPGRQYLETFTTYQAVEDTFHTIDVHKESGMWFFASDGYTAMPVTAINKNLDLGDCSVKFEVYSKTVAPTVKIYPVETGILKSYIVEDFVQFGSDIVTYNADDTVKLKIADKLAEEFPGTELRYREQLINTVGYDVRKPINIEYSYDVSNASAVWYAVGLGRPDVLDTISKIKYDVNATNVKASGGYGDNIAAKNDGIMFQTTTGLAQPTNRDQNSRLSPYITNSKSKPYSGRDDMDLVTFIVKENGTDMYMNGELIFDNLATKLSDFEASGYKAYPYFHFFEDRANKDKGNTIVIKGVNAARRTDDTSLKVVGGSNADLEVGLTAVENGDITLWHYTDADGASVLTAVDPSLYSYDKTSEKLTVKYGYFDGKDYEVYKLYARNDGGSEEIEVRFSDPSLVTVPATTDKDVYVWIKGGTENLIITVDIHNGTWVSFSGGGLLGSQYTYTPGTDSSVGTISISKAYLNSKKVGEYTYTIKTTNVEKEEFKHEFKISIRTEDEPGEDSSTSGGGNSSSSSSDNSSASGGGNSSSDSVGGTSSTEASSERKSGCNSIIGGAGALTMLGAAAILLFSKKRN